MKQLLSNSLLADIRTLRPQQRLARISGILKMLMEGYFLMVVVSFFLGFLNMFARDQFADSAMPRAIMGFMYVVLGLVVIMISHTRIKTILGERSPDLVKNKLLVNSLTVVLGACIILAGWLIGTTYLSVEFGLWFLLRWAGGIFSIFILLAPYYMLKRIETGFNNRYKQIVLQGYLTSQHSGMQWNAFQSLPVEDFIQSKLFTFQTIEKYEGSDLFTSIHSGFKGSRLIVQQREQTTSNGKTEIKITELFNGYLFVADFNKSFKGETFVFPDYMRDILGEIYGEMANELVKRKATSLVQLEDPDFEKRFAVYSTDAVEARYLLSIKLIERINRLSDHFYQDISISFTGNKMYVAVATKKDLITPHLYGNLADEATIQKQTGQLDALLSIPESFDLRTRIWE